MKVKTLLYASIVASMIVALSAGVICLISFYRINMESVNVKRSAALTRDLIGTNLIIHEYLIYREQRPLAQWKLQSNRISTRLHQMRLLKSENQALLDGIKDNYEAVKSSFSNLVSTTGNSFPGVSSALIRQKENRLQSRILVKTHDIFNNAVQIARASEDYLLSSQKTALWGVLAAIFFLSLVNIGLFAFTARSILKPLNTLREGTNSVAKGNLDYQVETKSDNEIGQLAGAFNQMVNDLKSIMISKDELEQVVARRTKELKESEERYRSLVEAAPVSIMALRNGCIHFSNPAGARMLGFSDPDKMVGIPAAEVVAPESQQLVTERIKRLESGKDNPTTELALIRQDGIRITVESNSVSIQIDGIPTALIIARDITDRKRADQKIVEAYTEIKQLKDRLELENIYLREEIEVNYKHEEIIGKSKRVMEMLNRAEQVSKTDSTVLILGETGTGKELLARAIHKLSPRKNRQMAKINCAALPPTLIESELFGREKGAFTGAMARQIGHFEIADGSSIFLDEIGELPLEVQAKLLRVLQEGQFERLGNPRTISVNVRIIASTNRDLARAIAEGKFREDLYYRLNVFSITVPPLRNRIEDIPMLVWVFVKEFEKSMGKNIEKISLKSMAALQRYPWPGNIRELRNVVENAMIISTGKILKLKSPVDPSLNLQRDLKLEVVERNHIIDVLEKTSWRVSGEKGAAKLLGLKPTTLESRMKKLGIVRPR